VYPYRRARDHDRSAEDTGHAPRPFGQRQRLRPGDRDGLVDELPVRHGRCQHRDEVLDRQGRIGRSFRPTVANSG